MIQMFRYGMCNLPVPTTSNNQKYPEVSSWSPTCDNPGSPRSPAPLRLGRRKAAASSALCFSEPSLTSSVSLLLTSTSLGQILEHHPTTSNMYGKRKKDQFDCWPTNPLKGWVEMDFATPGPLTQAPAFLRGSLLDQRLRDGYRSTAYTSIILYLL